MSNEEFKTTFELQTEQMHQAMDLITTQTKRIAELEKENRRCREYQGFWFERLILEGKRIAELERKLLQYQDDYFEGGDV